MMTQERKIQPVDARFTSVSQDHPIEVGIVGVALAAAGISVLIVNAEVHLTLRIAGAVAFVLSSFAAWVIGWVYVFRRIPLTRESMRDFPLKHPGIYGAWMLYGWPIRFVRLLLPDLSDEETPPQTMMLWLENGYLVLWSALSLVWMAGFFYILVSLFE